MRFQGWYKPKGEGLQTGDGRRADGEQDQWKVGIEMNGEFREKQIICLSNMVVCTEQIPVQVFWSREEHCRSFLCSHYGNLSSCRALIGKMNLQHAAS